MGAMELVKRIFRKKTSRNLIILIVLLLVLALAVWHRLSDRTVTPPGSIRAVGCTECSHQMITRIEDINETGKVCEKCGGRLAYTWQCDECGYEFPMDPLRLPIKELRTMDKFRAVTELQRCPNCKSLRTHPKSVPKK